MRQMVTNSCIANNVKCVKCQEALTYRICSGVIRVFFVGAPPTRANYSWGKFFLGEILLGGNICKIGGKYEIERKRKTERDEGNRGRIWSAQGRYQSMKQWLWCPWEHTSSLFESNCKIFWVYLLGPYKWGKFRCSPTRDRKLVTPLHIICIHFANACFGNIIICIVSYCIMWSLYIGDNLMITWTALTPLIKSIYICQICTPRKSIPFLNTLRPNNSSNLSILCEVYYRPILLGSISLC